MNTIFDCYSMEATAKDAASLASLPLAMPRPVAVFVPYLNEESDETRIGACAAVRAAGLVPVPHISARRVPDVAGLDRLLARLREAAAVDRLFLIAGDLPHAAGPFADSLSIITSGLLERHGIAHVGIAGHPEGHPAMVERALWQTVSAKLHALEQRGIAAEIVTQFSFDAQGVLRWLHDLRARGVTVPVRIGVPGPAGVRTLLRYATRCGVSASASAVAKYGLSLGRLLGHAGPDAFLAELGDGFHPADMGSVHVHIFPFGGFDRLAEWMIRFTGHTSDDVKAA